MKVYFVFLSWTLILLFACDSLFSTREPEPPKETQSPWIPPINYEQVLLNLQNAVYNRNMENYIRCLVNVSFSERYFVFEPDPDVAANYPEIFHAWDVSKEETVIRQAFSMVPSDSTSLLQLEDISEVIAADSAVIVKNYRLELHHIQSTLPSIYEGHIELWMAPDQRGEWSIYRWIDNGLTGFYSWSLLKASLGG